MTRDEIGRKCLVGLVQHVLEHQGRTLTGITYQDLARRIGFFSKNGNPQSRLGQSLGKMGHLLKTVNLGWNEHIPELQALVVGKTTGIPDDGINEFWKGYENLSRAEKENKALAEWQRIAEFGSRWSVVLQQLNLRPVQNQSEPASDGHPGRYGTGGESQAHKELKEFVSRNPATVGVHSDAAPFVEYALPSLDMIDVLFKTPTCWTAVEVKSTVSDGVTGDYERGVYQTVKYHALLEAMRKDARYAVPANVVVWLVLEARLPESLRELAANLQIRVRENVRQPSPV